MIHQRPVLSGQGRIHPAHDRRDPGRPPGLGNVTAAVAAGLLVGVLEAASISVLPLAYKDVVALAIMLAILFFRPEGLFGGRRAVLAGTR